MDTTIKMRITKGQIPMFKNSWSDEFIRFVDMPNFETFKGVYRRNQKSVNENQLGLYYSVVQARYEGKTMREVGRLVSRSAERVRGIEQRFLRNLWWYEQYVNSL